jgi:hypothetical protein
MNKNKRLELERRIKLLFAQKSDFCSTSITRQSAQ